MSDHGLAGFCRRTDLQSVLRYRFKPLAGQRHFVSAWARNASSDSAQHLSIEQVGCDVS